MADAPETLETAAVEEPRSRFDPRRLALILGVVLALFALVYFLFLRGGGEEAPPENLPDLGAPVESPAPSETPDEDGRGEGRGRVETFEVFAARDPFEPLVGAGAGPGAEGGTDTGAGGDDGDGGATPPPTDGGVDGGGGDGSDAIGGHRVRVVDVFPRGGRAQVQVDGTVYTVDEGERFADNFELLRAEGRCATMLFGDDEFTLCEGEEILK